MRAIRAFTVLMRADEEAADAAETRAEMLQFSGRGYLQLRHVLVQLPERDSAGSRASTLARFVHERKHRALLLYLLLLTCWPWLEERRLPLQSDVWIRALSAPGALTWTSSTLSRAWADLEDLRLVEKRRDQRLVRVVPRREDAGEAYSAPGGRSDRVHTYFILPGEFWTEEVFARLSLPGLAMLLVIAKETSSKSEFRMTYANADEWFGIKPKTAQNGIRDLEEAGLVRQRAVVVKAPLSPSGSTVQMWYSLTGAFSQGERKALQIRTAKERARRLKRGDTADGSGAHALGSLASARPARQPRASLNAREAEALLASWRRGSRSERGDRVPRRVRAETGPRARHLPDRRGDPCG
jgi:hypothetical protein